MRARDGDAGLPPCDGGGAGVGGWGWVGGGGGRWGEPDDAPVDEADRGSGGLEERCDLAGGAGRDGVQIEVVEGGLLPLGSVEGRRDACCYGEGVTRRHDGEDVVCFLD